MCGIAGACWSSGVDRATLGVRLDASIDAMRNRGPSSSGHVMWSPDESGSTVIGLANTRLAVLDLSSAGAQPMTTPDGRFTIVYNGEVTNYIEIRSDLAASGVAFTSTSDTEVLLKAWARWGREALTRVEGMYAFAVLDRGEATVTVCRDPFGIKPLYFRHLSGEGFAFGSELASLLPLVPGPRRLNWRTAARFLSSGYCDDSVETFIEGISHVMPGTVMTVDLRTMTMDRWQSGWRPSIRTDDSLRYADAVDGVRSLFLTSVERNLRSDAPVGIALSGGIDSSAIAAAAHRVDPELPLRLFTYRSSDARTDETEWAGKVARSLGADVHVVCPSADDLADDVDDLIVAQGEPFASTSIYAQYRVFRLMHEHGIVVSLDGQGGDEVFGGYHGFAGQRVRSLVETGDLIGAARFASAWGGWPGRSLPKALALSAAEVAPRWSISAASRVLPGYALPGVRMAALRDRGLTWGWLPAAAPSDGLRGVRVKAELRSAMTVRGLQALLRHGDRNSMRFSVESRVPFLDRSLVDYVLSFPEHWLVDRAGTTKAILRASMVGLVPDEVLHRRDKIGFEGDPSWVDSRREAIGRAIADAPEIGFLDRTAILRGLAEPAGRGRVGADQAWRLFSLYRWADLLDVDCS